jgi:ribosomal protein S18 acetylase RimI-like enzyme
MPEIEIRPAVETDIQVLIQLDHSFTSDHAWQMDYRLEAGQLGVVFREARLPRPVKVEYPRSPGTLAENWQKQSELLVAILNGQAVGYASLSQGTIPFTTWLTDVVVAQRFRRQGIGSALVLAAQEWVATKPTSQRLMLEMQPKNHPAIQFVQKLGFDFCGFIDHYYPNQDAVLLFAKWLM